MQTIKKLLHLLSYKERKRASLLLIMILLMAFIDMLGIASILPFIAILTSPEIIDSNTFLNKVYKASNIVGVNTKHEFLVATGIGVFLLLIFSLTFKALTTYFQTRFIKMCEYNISRRLLEYYLNQPYSWFLNRNSAFLGKSILSEVSNCVGKGLNPFITLITSVIITLTIFILLVFVDFKLTLIAILTMSIFYGLIYSFNRNLINRLGEEVFKSNEQRYKVLNEAFGGSKEVKIRGLEQAYINQFAKPANKIAVNSALLQIVAQIPRFSLEAIAFGGMILIILYYMTLGSGINNVLPIIALYAFAGYRLLPAIQKIYISVTSLRFVGPSLESLNEDLKKLKPKKQDEYKKEYKETLNLKKNIILRNVNYHYPNSEKPALKNVNLTIPVNNTIGLVGKTGSGKTTTIDIILGLLEAQEGTLQVDEKIINNSNIRSWQQSIGYVPQNIFLIDNTVSANIALGERIKDIDQEAVERAAKIANLHDFIINELPLKYQTTIGERGVRLSGGQRQRIGIARALYHKPQVLVFDEATSALDNLTEKAVMDAVHNSKNDITKILVAHRLSTVRKCDKIFMFDKGELKKEGTFEELIKNSDEFRSSAYNS
tara:strand:- start:485 stop:2290 length:1806 start_codon:yes stop_codon:yes gene_type:complete